MVTSTPTTQVKLDEIFGKIYGIELYVNLSHAPIGNSLVQFALISEMET